MITIGSAANNSNSLFQLRKSHEAILNASNKLVSGKRINSAKDDPTGLAIASLMTSQIRENNQSIRNANDGISFNQVADGALASASESLQRVRELAVQASNGTLSDSNRQSIQAEINQLTDHINDISKNTTFNGINVFDDNNSLNIQAGSEQGISIELANLDEQDYSAQTMTSASDTISEIDNALEQLNEDRSRIGATQSRLISTIDSLSDEIIQSESSRSRIEDADYAQSVSELIKAQLNEKASIIMLVKRHESDKAMINQILGS